MGVDRWDGGVGAACSSCPRPPDCLRQLQQASSCLSALPAWLSVWQMRAAGCYPQGLLHAYFCHSRVCAPPSAEGGTRSSAVSPVVLAVRSSHPKG